MRTASRRDERHSEIVDELESAGFFVADTSRVGGGFPDLCVSRNSVWALVELKTPRGRKTALERRSQAQIDFGYLAKGPIITAYTDSQVVYEFNLLLKRREAWAL